MKKRLFLWIIILLPSLLFIFAGQCENSPEYVGDWSTGSKNVFIDLGAGQFAATLKADLTLTEDTYESYVYMWDVSDWTLLFGGKGILIACENIMTFTVQNEYHFDIQQWVSATGTQTSHYTISDDTFTGIYDANEDGIYDNTYVFDNGAVFNPEYDYKAIYYRQ